MQKLKKIMNALFLDASGFAVGGAVICSLSEAVPFSFLFVLLYMSIAFYFIMNWFFQDKYFMLSTNLIFVFSWLICFLNWEFLYHLAVKSWYQFLGK